MNKLVSPFTERPQKKYYSYDPEKRYQFVLFDTETTFTSKQAEICQLSAISQNGHTFSSHITPINFVGFSASKVNNLTVENQNIVQKFSISKLSHPGSSITIVCKILRDEQSLHTSGPNPVKIGDLMTSLLVTMPPHSPHSSAMLMTVWKKTFIT